MKLEIWQVSKITFLGCETKNQVWPYASCSIKDQHSEYNLIAEISECLSPKSKHSFTY